MFVGRNANILYPCPHAYSSLGYTADTDSYLIREAVNLSGLDLEGFKAEVWVVVADVPQTRPQKNRFSRPKKTVS
jgi:hypothetical protein